MSFEGVKIIQKCKSWKNEKNVYLYYDYDSCVSFCTIGRHDYLVFYFLFHFFICSVKSPMLYMGLWKTAILNAYLIKFLNFFNQFLIYQR